MEVDKIQRLPLAKETVEAMKSSAPQIYNEMVCNYGEDNVVNNLLTPVIVLTEDDDIVYDKDNKSIKVSAELIKKAKRVNNSLYSKYVKEPIHKLKSLITGGDASLGEDPIYLSLESGEMNLNERIQNYTPITINHSEVSDKPSNDVRDRKGFIKDGSYHVVKIDGKHHLMAYQVLIDPETKFNYLNGKWTQVSPTLDPNTGVIDAVSIVNKPAQKTNISMSAGDILSTILPKDIEIVDDEDDWDSKISAAKELDKISLEKSIADRKQNLANQYTTELLRRGVITSSNRNLVKDLFTKLDMSVVPQVADVFIKVKKSPLNNKPRNVFLQGNLYMSKSYDERYFEFAEKHKAEYSTTSDIKAAFEKYENNLKVSLQAGEGTVIEPMADIESKLQSMLEGGSLTEEHKNMLRKYCGHDGKTSMGGEMVDGGTSIGVPNNSSLEAPAVSLSAPEPVIADQSKLVETLQAAYDGMKLKLEKLESEKTALIENIKKTLGGN